MAHYVLKVLIYAVFEKTTTKNSEMSQAKNLASFPFMF
jgi:hypothetical protein